MKLTSSNYIGIFIGCNGLVPVFFNLHVTNNLKHTRLIFQDNIHKSITYAYLVKINNRIELGFTVLTVLQPLITKQRSYA